MKAYLTAVTPAMFSLFVKKGWLKAYPCIAVFLVTGCAVLDTHQAQLDQKQLRQVLLDYNQDQILDNLIRAYNGLPIAQFDIKTVTATVASKITPSVTGGKTGTSSRYPGNSVATTTTTDPVGAVTTAVTRTVGSVASAVGTVMRPFSYTVGGERSNTVLVDVKPADEVGVYAAYVKFLNAADNPSPAERSCGERKESELELSKVTTTISKPTAVKTTTDVTPASPGTSPAASITNEVKETDATASTITEEVPKAANSKKRDKEEVENSLVVKAHLNSPGQGIKPLMETPAAPARADVLVGPKRWRDNYYWVPVRYRKAFFELCLATVTKGTTTGTAAAGAGSARTKAQKESGEIKEELEDFNSLQRLRLGTPP